MKLISILLTLALISVNSAQAGSLEPQMKLLKSFSAKDLTDDKKKTDKSKLKIDEMFDVLEGLSKTFETETPTVEILSEACRVAELTYANDPTEYSAELLLPTFQKHKNVFMKVFTKGKFQRCKTSLESAAREDKAGNG